GRGAGVGRTRGVARRLAAQRRRRSPPAVRPPLRPAKRWALPAPKCARRPRERGGGRRRCARRALCHRGGRVVGRARRMGTRTAEDASMTYQHRLTAERWLAWVRIGAIPFALYQSAIT